MRTHVLAAPEVYRDGHMPEQLPPDGEQAL